MIDVAASLVPVCCGSSSTSERRGQRCKSQLPCNFAKQTSHCTQKVWSPQSAQIAKQSFRVRTTFGKVGDTHFQRTTKGTVAWTKTGKRACLAF